MFVSNFRVTAAAILIASGAALATSPAFAAGVRREVGNPLKEAQQDAAGGRCEAAKAKINQAEGVGGKTAAESSVISQMRQYVGVVCGDTNSALGMKSKFAKDYNAGRYRDAIADEDGLRKFGVLDGENMLIIAQAYYKLGDYGGCVRYIKSHFGGGGGQNSLELMRRCAFENGDTDTQRDALEQLVTTTGKPEYWSQLLDAASKTHGLNDHQTLDIYRIKLLTGSIKTADEVKLISELAIENGDSAEAVNIITKSAAIPGVANNDRFNRLLNTAKAQAAADAANLAKASATANGDGLVKLGEAQWALKPADTVRLVQMGIQKGVTDKANAQIRLGMGYLSSGQKDSAARAFSSAKNDPKWQVIARLWLLYSRR